MAKQLPNVTTFRFYEELNDFLPEKFRKKSFDYTFSGNPCIKDAIEALGVPHTEVDLILVNDQTVDFNYQLKSGDRVAVYPVFEMFDITEVTELPKRPLRELKFILDVHLGKLAKYLRMLGFDCLYKNNYSDEIIIKIAMEQPRIILTRDKGLLKNSKVTRGYFVRATDPNLQLIEIYKRFDLANQIKPLIRCLNCNGIIKPIEKSAILKKLPLKTRQYYDKFFFCTQCQKIYWQGSHYENMLDKINAIKK